MVVDDDEWMRTYLKSVLESASYTVDVVETGREAMRRLRIGNYDILLTDCQMPDVDGLTLCGLVRSEFADRSPYVLMFTVMDTRADRYAGFNAGADDYVIKGSPSIELLDKLHVGRQVRLSQRAAADSHGSRRKLSFLDPLTNAHNFKYFAKQTPTGIRRTQRSHRALGVINCRIEAHEPLSRQFGHAADDTLSAFAAQVRDCLLTSSYWFAQVGEQRFVIVLPCSGSKIAARLARKISRQFASVAFAASVGTIRLSVSVDITACEPRGSRDRLPWEAIESSARIPSIRAIPSGCAIPSD
jgi:diguanylate cyclase (GGDEF)-like protein